MKSSILACFSMLSSAALAASPSPAEKRPHLTLNSGKLVGIRDEDIRGADKAVEKWLGIPYAERPSRFRLAQPVKPWEGIYMADRFGPSCPQYFLDNSIAVEPEVAKILTGEGAIKESENCLFINVFVPKKKHDGIVLARPGDEKSNSSATADRRLKPVMVHIHGGGWQFGHGGMDLSGFAANEDIVAVSFNYRTNIFGFPNTVDLPVIERNLGLHDQRLALRWVQKNIKEFGGDPEKVTIWGQSAGAMSTDLHLQHYTEEENRPFRGAIMSSGQMTWGPLATTADPEDHSVWEATAKGLGCNPGDGCFECVKKADIRDVIEVITKLKAEFHPVMDNDTVPAGNRAKAWEAGNVSHVPVLVSNVFEEGRSLIKLGVNLDEFMERYLPEPAFTLFAREQLKMSYRGRPELKTDFDVAAAIDTDFLWHCAMLANVSASIENPTYRILFNASVTDLLPEGLQYLGKFHGSDVLLAFLTPSYEHEVVDKTGTNETIALPEYVVNLGNTYRGFLGKFVRDLDLGKDFPQIGDDGDFTIGDMVSLGQVGNAVISGGQLVNRTMVDEVCEVYQDAYSKMETMLYGE